MVRRRSLLAAAAALPPAALIAGSAVGATAAPATPSRHVHAFYYPWYGNPSFYGSWRHWNGTDHTPPDDITSNFYPTAGPYDSGDVDGVVAQHMAWLRQAGVGVAVTSWWGQGSYEDQRVPGLLSAAAAQDIQIAWHIEPYTDRTAASVVSDVGYINDQYGGSSAFFRDAEHGNRPAFYVFDSLAITDWSALDAVNGENLILTQTTDISKTDHFGGMYNYAVGTSFAGWDACGAYCRDNGKVWSPSVGPGYIDRRAKPGSTATIYDRDDGAMYDGNWSGALATANGGPPTWVSITSFNEWHEGTMIEPATASPPGGYGYLTYDGAYGSTGTAAETAYLDRTNYWVGQLESMLGSADSPRGTG
jgi:glycoprotein endo-alpha-1,2-mannosidase